MIGAIAGLVLMPAMAPVWGFRFVLQRLMDEAESVMYDEGRGFAALMDLSMRRSAGKISDEEYAEQETELLERLKAIREYKDELARAEMGEDEDEDECEDEDEYEEEGEYDDDDFG